MEIINSRKSEGKKKKDGEGWNAWEKVMLLEYNTKNGDKGRHTNHEKNKWRKKHTEQGLVRKAITRE